MKKSFCQEYCIRNDSFQTHFRPSGMNEKYLTNIVTQYICCPTNKNISHQYSLHVKSIQVTYPDLFFGLFDLLRSLNLPIYTLFFQIVDVEVNVEVVLVRVVFLFGINWVEFL